MFVAISKDITVNMKNVSSVRRGAGDRAIVQIGGERIPAQIDYDTMVEIIESLDRKGKENESGTLQKLDGFLNQVGVPKP
jgi:hypothetical protein